MVKRAPAPRKRPTPKKPTPSRVDAALSRTRADLTDAKAFLAYVENVIPGPLTECVGFLEPLQECRRAPTFDNISHCLVEVRRTLQSLSGDVERARRRKGELFKARLAKLERAPTQISRTRPATKPTAEVVRRFRDALAVAMTTQAPEEALARRRIESLRAIDHWVERAHDLFFTGRDSAAIDRMLARALATAESIANDRGCAEGPSSDAMAATHSDDFTSVHWFGTPYRFTPGQQARVVEILWEQWKKGTNGLSQSTIAERVGSDSDHFKLSHVFRDRKGGGHHPAFRTMIRPLARGVYGLIPPTHEESTKNPP